MQGEGPFSLIVIGILDWIFDSVYTGLKEIFQLTKDAFNLTAVDKSIEIFPSNRFTENKYYIPFNYLRHFVTIATPPVGVFMSKGLKGWFNVLITIMFCYINYFLGIIYAFLLTFQSKYANAYAAKQKQIRDQAQGIDSTDPISSSNKVMIMFFTALAFIFIGIFFYLIVYIL